MNNSSISTLDTIRIARIVRRLPKYGKLVWLLVKDPELPGKQRVALTAAVGYSVSPIDAVPGIIPVVGQLDDLAIVLYTVRWVLNSLPVDKAHRYLTDAGLTVHVIDEDFDLVRDSGVKIIRKTVATIGTVALWTIAIGKYAGKEIKRGIEKRKASKKGPVPIRAGGQQTSRESGGEGNSGPGAEGDLMPTS